MPSTRRPPRLSPAAVALILLTASATAPRSQAFAPRRLPTRPALLRPSASSSSSTTTTKMESSLAYATAGDASAPPQTGGSDAAGAESSSDVTAILRDGAAKMGSVMTAEFFSSSPTLKQLRSQCVKSVEVRESSIPGAGLGLFARKNIKANTVICFYPAHALGIDVDGGDDRGGSSFVSATESDGEHFRTHPSGRSSYLHCTDQPIFKRPSLLSEASPDYGDTPLYLDVNPNRHDDDDAWVSHRINDGAAIVFNTEEGVLEYYRASGEARNCVHIPFGPSPVMATVTTKKVKKGRELFTSYGCTYWLGALLDGEGRGAQEEAVGMTAEIRRRIQETANDLFRSMESAAVVYASQAEALRTEFDKIRV